MLFASAVLLGLVATASSAPLSKRQTASYTVKAGDDCTTIAGANGITAAELMAANTAIDADCLNLTVGQVLAIPGADDTVDAAPAPADPPALTAPITGGSNSTGGSTDVTAAQILAAAPTSATCDPAAAFADECRTAEQAAPFISQSFAQFGIDSVGEKAALVSLMAFETGDFKFDKNHFPPPGRPGQGTRNLMTFPFVYQYALDTPSVAAQALALAPDPATASNDTQNAVRALVLPDELSFASAAWFLKASGQCSDAISQGLKGGTQAAWETYITDCVGTTVTDERLRTFNLALAAFS